MIALSFQTMKAQLGFSHEVGAIVGPVAFQSDYGENQNFDTNKAYSFASPFIKSFEFFPDSTFPKPILATFSNSFFPFGTET